MKRFFWVWLVVLVAAYSYVPFAWCQSSAICKSTASAVGVLIHPELLPGEKFIGNFTAEQYFEMKYVTARLGKTAYDHQSCKLIDSDIFRPVFVMNDELIQGDKVAREGDWQITGCRNFHDEKGKLIGRNVRFSQGFGHEKNFYFEFKQEHSSWDKVKGVNMHEWVRLEPSTDGNVNVK